VLLDSSQSELHFETTTAAQDALLLVGSSGGSGGVLISSTSNRFEDVLEGVRLDITGATGAPVKVTVATTSSDLVTRVQATVDAYNTLRDKLSEYTFFNADENTTGVLFGSNEAVRIDSELSELFSRRFFGVGRIQAFEQIGLSLGQDGKLSLDQTALQAKFGEDPEAVTEFFTKEKIGAAARIDALIETMAGRDKSLLVSRAQALAQKIELNTERIEAWNARLERSRERMLLEFYRMELAIGKIQNNSGAIQAIAPLSIDRRSNS
jgi:flagellar hook-associated protein 2